MTKSGEMERHKHPHEKRKHEHLAMEGLHQKNKRKECWILNGRID